MNEWLLLLLLLLLVTLLAGGRGGVRLALLVAGSGLGALEGATAIFLQELLGGVVAGGFFEFLDGGVALFLEGVEVGLCLGDAVVVVPCGACADGVDSVCGEKRSVRFAGDKTRKGAGV